MKRSRRAPSLALRLAVLLVTTQIATFIIAFITVLAVFKGGVMDSIMGADVVNKLVASAVTRTGEVRGALDDDGLRSFMARHPGSWFIATNGSDAAVGGRDPGFERGLEGMAEAVRNFVSSTRDDFPIVDMTPMKDGKLVVAAGGARAGMSDAWDVIGVFLNGAIIPVSIPITLSVTVVMLFATRRALRSIRTAAAAAAEISSDRAGARLPIEGLPSELVPLVGAVNEALRRIDEGNERRRRFIADAAHELRSPIAVLRTRLDALPDTPLKDTLSRDAERLSDLASRLLEMERTQCPALEETVFDLSAMAREAAAEIAPEMIEAGREVEVIAEAPVRVRADRDALRGATLNLLRNAATHGAGAIRARVAPDGAIEVSDEGPGVPAGEGERVFEPFHRASRSRSGAGLGLAISRQTMRAHGGDAVSVETDTPGAVFRLTLPPERVEVGNDVLNPPSRPRFGPSNRRDNRDAATSRPAGS